MKNWLFAASTAAMMALATLPASAEMTTLNTAELRAISGQGTIAPLVYDPPPFVLKLEQLATYLEEADRPVAATIVSRKALFLGRIFDGCPPGRMCIQ
ncbi:MAG: hypothetical protein SVU69_11850 [Pseudomonadota bacterium]|nr:hypothetical protein [Pseudomonadota bacterium]